MILNSLGHTGLTVSALGFGAMHIHDERTTEQEAGALLTHVLDEGITRIDTARGPLAPRLVADLRGAFARHGGAWAGLS